MGEPSALDPDEDYLFLTLGGYLAMAGIEPHSEGAFRVRIFEVDDTYIRIFIDLVWGNYDAFRSQIFSPLRTCCLFHSP